MTMRVVYREFVLYNELKAILLEHVKKAKYYALASDGYETSEGRHFVDVLIHAPGNPALTYKTVDTTATSLNKQAIIDILKESVFELDYNKWLGSV